MNKLMLSCRRACLFFRNRKRPRNAGGTVRCRHGAEKLVRSVLSVTLVVVRWRPNYVTPVPMATIPRRQIYSGKTAIIVDGKLRYCKQHRLARASAGGLSAST